MQIQRFFVLAAGLLLLTGRAAGAQDAGSIGVTMGYPSIGVIWHASDKVAIRPEVSLTGSHSDSSDSDSLSVSTGLSALLYGGAGTDNVRPYFSPRFTYAHSGLDTTGSTGSRLHSSTRSWS